jgi:DNA polymerase-3 subunit delta'
VFLKILEEPPPTSTLILTAPSPYALLPTIVSRCLQFHFAPVPQNEVEKILKAKSNRKSAEIHLAAQYAEGSPGRALEMEIETVAQRRRDALRILEHSANGHGYAQLFRDTSSLAKDREIPFEEQLGVFYGLLCDLAEIASGVREPALRNAPLKKELEALSKSINPRWVMRALASLDELNAGMRRNLNRQLGLEALAVSLGPDSGLLRKTPE